MIHPLHSNAIHVTSVETWIATHYLAISLAHYAIGELTGLLARLFACLFRLSLSIIFVGWLDFEIQQTDGSFDRPSQLAINRLSGQQRLMGLISDANTYTCAFRASDTRSIRDFGCLYPFSGSSTLATERISMLGRHIRPYR